MFLFNNLAASPEWRNWQTRWTQNPVVLSTVWVRPPPLEFIFSHFQENLENQHKHWRFARCNSAKFCNKMQQKIAFWGFFGYTGYSDFVAILYFGTAA